MGKPMGRHPITHYKNPKEPLAGSIRPTKQVISMISASPGFSFLDHCVKVQKVVKPDQGFLKSWSRANRSPTLACDLSRVTQVWEMLLQRPLASLELPQIATSLEPPAKRALGSSSL
jgi:hypothetical protein